MITLRRSYEEFKEIVQSKKLQPFLGNETSAHYHLLALDSDILYESIIIKNNSEEFIDFTNNDLSNYQEKKNFEPEWDSIVTSFPSSNTDLFTYRYNDQDVMNVRVEYLNNSKQIIQKITKEIL